MGTSVITNLSAKIDSYVQWAEGAGSGNRLAGLGKTDGADQVQNLKGIPRGAQSVARQAALDDFKRALTDTVGESIANQAWNGVKADKCKGLTASMIMKLVAKANDLFQKTLTHPSGVLKHLFNLQSDEIQSAVNGRNPPTETFKQQCRISVLVMRSNALLCMTPLTGDDVKTFQSRFNSVNDELTKCWADLMARGDLESRELANQLQGQIEALAAKSSEVSDAAAGFPGGDASLAKLADHWTAALNRACAKLSGGMSGTKPQIGKLQAGLERLKADMAKDGAMLKFLKANGKETSEKLQAKLDSCVKSVFGWRGTKKTVDGVKAGMMISKAHGDILNEAEWAPIRKTFTGSVGGQKLQFTSAIVSGNKICESIAERYEEGVNAYNSHSMGTSNAVNLATSKLTVTGPDGQPRTVFNGVRHGVHCAKDVKDKTERAAANAERARQTVMAAFTTYLEKHAKEAKAMADLGRPISFNMTSVALLTPILFTKEKGMLEDQKAAWDAVNGKTLEVKVGDTTYQVRPRILTFNFGVDKFSVDVLHFGWDASDKLNSKAIIGLQNRVKEFRLHHPPGTPERKAVDTLWRQIADILNSEGERTADHDAYKMPARISVLSYLMGDVPVWNCKSGKDRTGMLDVECKFLATLIDRGEEIPKPGAKLTEEQSNLLKTIAMESGNLEMQEYNTGIAGYKLYGGESTFERLGGSETKAPVKGGSHYAGS